MTEKTVRIYAPPAAADPGVEWAAATLTTLADMLGEFLAAVARLAAFLLGSVRELAVGRL